MEGSKAVLTAVFLIATSTFVLAQGTYTQIDVPGAFDTWAGSIDSAGDIDGYYLGSDSNYHGFLLSNGTFTTFDYPGAAYTFPGEINDKGQIAGSAVGSSEPPTYYGFLYDIATQTFTTISDPNASFTELCCINNAGLIAGLVSTTNLYGFISQDSKYRVLMPPGTSTNQALALTDVGVFLWGMTSSGTNEFFLYSGGKYTQITLPSKPQIFLDCVNPQGTVYVGSYSPNVNTAYGYLYDTKSNKFINLIFPNAPVTNAEGINRHGEVVGLFTDSSNKTHAFTWTP
jgi:probable HAF family extracellular repeat protein